MSLYNRNKAIAYAHKWAYGRNPKYYNFDSIGGDCTNFISQCIYEGCNVMNYNKYGWYYKNGNNKSPSWTGVEFLYNFLTSNNGIGPYAKPASIDSLEAGDIIQLSANGNTFSHTLLVVDAGSIPSYNNILIACHTIDRDYYPLSNYIFKKIRFIKILGCRL